MRHDPQRQSTWTAAILAGGKATRFGGRDKSALPLGGVTVLEKQLALLDRLVSRTIIVANDQTPFLGHHIEVIRDLVPGSGPLGGIYTAIQATGSPRTLVLACDMPFLTLPFLSYLIESGDNVDIAIPQTARGYEPLCATYSQACAGLLQSRIEAGHFKIADALANAGMLTIRTISAAEITCYDDPDHLFCNINTPADYARAVASDGFTA
jgi:molybdopterin-guanine dinucleotide biosynthesis protein A